jgi:hypothetical protein
MLLSELLEALEHALNPPARSISVEYVPRINRTPYDADGAAEVLSSSLRRIHELELGAWPPSRTDGC